MKKQMNKKGESKKSKVKLKAGPDEAAKILEGLGMAASDRILDYIKEKNPKLADKVQESMVTFEDLQYLSATMLMELYRDIKMEDLALGLRIASKKLQDHIFKYSSVGMKKDLEAILNGPPQSVNDVQLAVEKVMKIMREKVKLGKIVIDRTDGNYV
jgi:flagellar motor switch protein FliG